MQEGSFSVARASTEVPSTPAISSVFLVHMANGRTWEFFKKEKEKKWAGGRNLNPNARTIALTSFPHPHGRSYGSESQRSR